MNSDNQVELDPGGMRAMSREPELNITLMSGPHDGDTYHFNPINTGEPFVVTIGRRAGCDIVLDYDAQVSRVHAKLIYDARDTEFFLEDADSRNGTFVGQTRLRNRIHLEPGTLFRVGRTWLRLDSVDIADSSITE